MLRRTALKAVVGLFVLTAGASSASAFEKVEIVNQSNLPVTFTLKWSNLPQSSATITLLPGESFPQTGPNGEQLTITYNANCGSGLPVIRSVVLKTAKVNNPNQPGYRSSFVNTGPVTVGLTAN